MSEPFISEIRLFPYSFAPQGWTFCNGQLMPINQYTPLYSVIGTTYGGDGVTSFGVPALNGRTAMHAGQGPGLSAQELGDHGGSANVTLAESNLPEHRHAINTEFETSELDTPTGNVLGVLQDADKLGNRLYCHIQGDPPLTPTPVRYLDVAGHSKGHENLQPYLVLTYFMAFEGIYPPRS